MKHKPYNNEFWNEKEAKELFQILPFYNVLIEKLEIKHLSNIGLLHELPFYDKSSVVEVSKGFKRYARSYKVEIIDFKDPSVQLEASKSSIKDLFKDLLNEMKGFKYKITLKTLLSKEKQNKSIEYSIVHFNSITKTVINSEFNLNKSFQEILYRIDNWINDGSGWKVESINSEYVNISMYSPLIGSTFVKLPDKLKNSKNSLINIKNNDNKCFLWCYVRHLNSVSKNPQRITKEDKKLVSGLNYERMEFPNSRKDYCKVEKQNNIFINVFCYENGLTYPIYVSGEKLSDCMNFLLIFDENKSHYVYIKALIDLCLVKQRIETKSTFINVVCSVLVVKTF